MNKPVAQLQVGESTVTCNFVNFPDGRIFLMHTDAAQHDCISVRRDGDGFVAIFKKSQYGSFTPDDPAEYDPSWLTPVIRVEVTP